MNFGELKEFISNKMLMQHVYQPVMIKTLLQSDNKASVREIAQSFLQLDESQIDYYKMITKQMPGRVLKNRGVVTQERDSYSINVTSLTDVQRSELISMCNNKITEYIESRGGERAIWLHRMKNPSYIPGTIRFEVLKRAKGRCELCGIPSSIKFLQVDHIKPRNKMGESKIENYQALCYTCNAQKMDKDDTDFREWNSMYEYKKENCPFCKTQSSTIAENSMAIAFEDKYPIVKYHTLITPLRHTPSFFNLGTFERKACLLLIDEVRQIIMRKDKTVTGFNVGFNDGEDAGQTVFHSHIHVIPRRKDDVPNPRGGIRNMLECSPRF